MLVLTVLCGCSKRGVPAPAGGSDVPPAKVQLARNVDLARAEQRSLNYFVETVGYLEAEGQTEIAAGVTGIVDEVLFEEGQKVDRDTVLVKVDQPRYEVAENMADANALRARANLVMAQDVEKRATSSGYATSPEEKARALQTRGMAEADLKSAQAALALARHNLSRSRVRAPYPGQINQRKVTRGTYLEEKTVIATMADLSRLRLVGYIPEKAAPTVKRLMRFQEQQRKSRITAALFMGPACLPGLATLLLTDQLESPASFGLEFTVLPFPQQTFRGRIFYMSTTASPDTHMFECKAVVHTYGLDVPLEPGFTARIRVPLQGNPSACVVPEESVRASEQGFIAFVPVPRGEGKQGWIAEARPVELGYRSPGWVEVLQGLKPGEWIVRKGAEALENGTLIQFPEAQATALSSSR